MLLRTIGFALATMLACITAWAGTPPVPAPKPLPPERRVHSTPPLPAKQLFKSVKVAAAMPPAPIGYYTRGCLAGGERLRVLATDPRAPADFDQLCEVAGHKLVESVELESHLVLVIEKRG